MRIDCDVNLDGRFFGVADIEELIQVDVKNPSSKAQCKGNNKAEKE